MRDDVDDPCVDPFEGEVDILELVDLEVMRNSSLALAWQWLSELCRRITVNLAEAEKI